MRCHWPLTYFNSSFDKVLFSNFCHFFSIGLIQCGPPPQLPLNFLKRDHHNFWHFFWNTNLPIQILELNTKHSSSAVTSGKTGLVSEQPPIILRHSKFKEISKMKVRIASLVSRLVRIARISGLNGISGLVSYIWIAVLISYFGNPFSFSEWN